MCVLASLLLGALSETARAQGTLTNGWTHTGNISPAGDSDSWTFTASAGDGIVVRVGELSSTAFAPRVQLFSPTSVLLATSTSTIGAEIAVVATNSGTFTAVVTDNAGTQTNAYRLTLANSAGAVFVAPGDEGGPLTNGVMHTGTINVGDLDVWTVSATAGQSVVVRMGEVTPSSTLNPQVRIYGPNGAPLGNVESTDGAEVAVTATNSGMFLVVAGDYAPSWSGSGPYRLTLAKTDDAVVVSAGDEGGPLTNGVMHTGTIDEGDLDVWTVAATVGQSIVVRMGETNNVAFSPQLRIYDPSGALLNSIFSTIGAEVTVTATNNGTFLIVAGDFAANWSGSGPYRLTLGKTGDSVVVSPADEGGLLTNGVMHTGTITVGDLDVWTLSATAGQRLVVRMGEVTPSSTLNPQVRIYGPSGALLGNVETGAGAEVAVTATNSGTFLVVAGDYAANWSGSGPYRLTMAKTGDPVVVSPGDEGGTLTNGVMHTGMIDVGDLDLWTVAATVGQSIVVRMAETNNVLFSSQLRIYDPSGALLNTIATTIGAEVAVTATNSGTFLVVAGDFAANWSGSGAYRLTLAKTGDAVVVSPGDEGGLLTNGVMHTGMIDVGDLDLWTVAATVGQNIVVRMGEVTGGSTLNPEVRIYGPNGALLGNVETLTGAEVAVTTTNTGTFLVVAGDYATGWSGSGAYRLTLAKTGEPAAISAGDDGGPMNGDGFYAGTIGVGDLDVWTFTACPGETIFLRMEETVGGSPLTPQLRLYGRDGSLLNTASGLSAAQISRTAPAGGNYTVVAGDFSGNWGGSGAFTLTVSGLSEGLKLCIPLISGTNVTLGGIGGATNSTFILFTHTNVATPVASWLPILTNQFDQFGVFSRTNISGRYDPQRYFHLLQQ